MASPILLLDFETTCTNDGTLPPERMEVIDVGAAWATPAGEVLASFQSFAKPAENPSLSSFCTSLTGITQADIDAAQGFTQVSAQLATFAAQHACPGVCWYSRGASDGSAPTAGRQSTHVYKSSGSNQP